MPAIGAYHPHIVHFVIALLIAGVMLRLVSLTGRASFASHAAAALIIAGTLASVAAVKSGDDAHGPVERIPGVRAAVVEHEEWGERTRNFFILVSLMELVVLGLAARNSRRFRAAAMVSATAGLAGLLVLYEAAEHGGELVYGYAGGVGIRSGDPADVNRLFVAGAFHQALQDREAGRGDDGADLLDYAARRFPGNLELQLMSIEWTIDVRKDPTTGLHRLDRLTVPADDARLRVRAGLARAAALEAQGNGGGARAVLQTLQAEFPDNPAIQRRLNQLPSPAR